MKRMWVRAAATATAIGFVAGAVALAATGSTTAPNRPVRALGANGDGDVGTRGGRRRREEPAGLGQGRDAPPHALAVRPCPSRPPTRVPWVKRELRARGRRGGRRGGEARRRGVPGRATTSLDQADEALQADARRDADPAARPRTVAGLGARRQPLPARAARPERRRGRRVLPADGQRRVRDLRRRHRRQGRGARRFMSDLFDPGVPEALRARTTTATRWSSTTSTPSVWVISQFALNFNEAEVRGVHRGVGDERSDGRVVRLPVRLPERRTSSTTTRSSGCGRRPTTRRTSPRSTSSAAAPRL